mmetsp:Transcript_3085/g.8764  ORF Transcript_3085/g.8764 Transcript_3085/m.8764 type:complete len:634 (-) Transcript_3085:144-2045(-)
MADVTLTSRQASRIVSPSPTRVEFGTNNRPTRGASSAPAWITAAAVAVFAFVLRKLTGRKGEVASPPAFAPVWLADAAIAAADPGVLGACAISALVAGYVSVYAAAYARYTSRNALDIDAYCGHSPGILARFYLAFSHRLTSYNISREAAEKEGTIGKFSKGLPLKATPSPHVEGLLVTSRLMEEEEKDGEQDSSPHPLPSWPTSKPAREADLPVIVGTIRMGFGHHRIAYSACSWACAEGGPTYFHDLLGIQSREADMIKTADKMYSRGSRMASETGGVVEKVWDSMGLSGSENSMRQSWQMAEGLVPLMKGLDHNVPMIASHPLVGMVAVACGFKTVLSLVPDNHAQWFSVVPGALNLVQGPGVYTQLRKLGVPSEDLKVAGHWCPTHLVNNIPADCGMRLTTLHDEGNSSITGGRINGMARRTFLVPVGGAGAQRHFITELVQTVLNSGLLEQGTQLVLNAGDHAHMRKAFTEILSQPGAPEYEMLETLEEVKAAAADPQGFKRRAPVVVCAFTEYFPAVAATDILCRAADVLVCKPSELAFYPIPKLMIRRVGGHEQFSAVRAYELGDGTREIREVGDAVEWMRIMMEPGCEVLAEMNRRIITNGQTGIYDGAKNAVMWAKKLAAGEKI